jgi:hypothetical protein
MRTPRPLPFAALLVLVTSLPAQLAGPYTVGPGGSYPSMSAAIAALTTLGVSGPVSFLVLANDTGPWTIGAFPGQGAANPVSFDALGPVTLAGTQPLLTLNGCASVTFRGFNGTFAAAPSTFVINAGTTDCVFTGCDFRATTVATLVNGVALFHFLGGSGCRIEDSTFGGSHDALISTTGNDTTTVQRCRILGGGWRIMTLGGTNFTLVNNFITGATNYGINGGMPGTPSSGANLKIWHNAVFINHPTAGSQYCSLRWYSSAPGTEVVDNIFFDYYPTFSTGVFNLWCSGALRPGLMNYNCFWSNQAGYVPFYAGANLTLAQWQAAGFDANSFQADPMFTAPSATPADLSLQPGSPCETSGTTLASVLTDFFYVPRTTPVSIGAHELDSGAQYSVFGAGCAGTAGTPSNSASSPPRLGQNSVITFGNLPAPYLAIAMLGLSNTASAFGPLPVALAPFGAPGCYGRVSPDATLFLLGAGGSAGFTFPVPNQPYVLGFTFYTQGLVIDPLLNPLGASTSDAAVAIIGL